MQFALPTGGMISHPNLVAALAKPGDAILATLTAEQADAWHMASCIPGEAGELFEAILDNLNRGGPVDRVNLVEEMGDIEFYLQGLRAIVGIDRNETLNLPYTALSRSMTFRDSMYHLPVRAAEVFDVTKKWVIYNKPFDRVAMVTALANFEVTLNAVRLFYALSHAEVLAANVMKLGTRYASMGYSDAQAQARADKTVH